MNSAGVSSVPFNKKVSSIPKRWKELSGEKNWEGLLDPLDHDLRSLLINYGERAAATYYAFYNKNLDDCYGFSRFSEQHFFNRLGVDKNKVIPYKYDVKKFFYARAEFLSIFGQSTWCGYVAVANDETKTLLGRRDIVIAWRGTALEGEVLKDLEAVQTGAPIIFGEGSAPRVHYGFYSLYTSSKKGSTYSSQSAGEQVITVLKDLLNQYKDEEVSITVVGHSLGAALATLNGADIVANGHNKPDGDSGKSIPVTVFPFGSPRVGDPNFKTAFEGLKDLHLLRISNVQDRVTNLPPEEFIPINIPIIHVDKALFEYRHVGMELKIDTRLSPYMKNIGDAVHDVGVYLHGCAGSHGDGKEFKLEVDLDIALLNRGLDALVDDVKYGKNIPAVWWYPAENKDMIQYEDGDFKLKPNLYLPRPLWP